MGNNDQNKQGAAAFQADEEQIGRLLATLPRVDAPGDFDFRVKARIAAGRPAEKRGSWLPASVRMAVPLALVLMVGGYLSFNAFYSEDDIGVPVVAGVETQNFVPVPPSNGSLVVPTDQMVVDKIDVKPPYGNDELVAGREKPAVVPTARSDRRRGGSLVLAGREKRTIDLPFAGPDSNTGNGPGLPVSRSSGETLSAAGIDVAGGEGGFRVQSVTAGGSGQRSGIKPGDVITSILDHNKTLMIKRDGKTMRIVLKP